MTGENHCIVIFVRYPEKGAVKSRLASVLEEGLIVALYESFVVDLLATLEKSGHPFRIAFTPADRGRRFFAGSAGLTASRKPVRTSGSG